MVTSVGVSEGIVDKSVGIAVGVKTGVAVPVGDGITIDVAVGPAGVSVGVSESFVDVKLGDGKGNEVGVDESDAAVGEGIEGETVSVTD